MKKITLFVLLIYSAVLWPQTFSGSSGNISDDGQVNYYTATVSGLSSPLISSYGLIQVCLDITHTYDSDLQVQLVSPQGTTINLFTGLGGDGDNFTATCLNQSAILGINQGTAAFNGVYTPQETLGNQNTGQNGNGEWQLKILDTYPGADTGTVNSWSLQFGTDAAAPFVFTTSNLPIVIINTNGVPIVDDPKIDATMGIIYNGEGVMNDVNSAPNHYNGNIGIELRGNYSQGLPQKPYKLETRDADGEELNVSLLGMPEEHDWCLIANYNDKVFVRNTLAYSLFKDMGNYAVRSHYCEVVLNGEYQGVYMLMESIKRDNDRVDIAKLEDDENSGLDLTGGYIIKSDYWTDEDSWLLNHHPIDHPDFDVHLVYEYPKPEDITAEQKTYIQTFINDFETALYGEQFADPQNGYAKYIDTDTFIDYFIINELARNTDGFRKSCFFHKDKDESETEISKLKAGPVWDFDWAWKNIPGCSIFEATDGSGWSYEVNDCWPDVNSPGWYVRLMQDPAFQNRLRCRWEYFRSSFLSNESLTAFIDEKAEYLNEAQDRHFDKWGNLGINTGTPEVEQDPATFEAQIAQFKNWINLRLAWLDENIPGTSENCELMAVNEQQLIEFKLYPNPAKNTFHIVTNSLTQPDYVAIYDITGKLVFKVTVNSDGIIDVSSLANGIYICKITTNGSIHTTQKLVIQH